MEVGLLCRLLLVSWVAAHGSLRDGMTVDDAAAIVWTLTSPEVNQLLRDVRGWSAQRYVNWIADTLTCTLSP